MKSIYKYLAFSFLAVAASGCKKYVDIKTQGNLVPNQTINYRYLLNNTDGFEYNANLSDFANADINITDESQMLDMQSEYYGYFANSYAWKDVIYVLGSSYENDDSWNMLYKTILNCNTIINELPESNGTQAEKDALAAEALVHRADAYLVLLNNYAKPYDAATAATDLGVPLLTTQTVSQSLKRASVKVVYEQILADLLKAVPSLPATQRYNTLPSKVSAYGELARAYFYMKDYTNAAKYADLALATRSTLNDLSTFEGTTGTYPLRINDPEILLSKVPIGGQYNYYSPTIPKLSDEFLSLLGTQDLRYTLFTVPGTTVSENYTGRFFDKETFTGQIRNEGPSVPEMLLIKAEAFARAGDAGTAMLWLNRLREKRFRPADYVPATATSANDALVKVVQERRREFFGIMLPWWDMRRLKNEAPFERTYTRVVNGETSTLTPNSNRYVFPIAESLRRLNPELEPNP